MVRTLLASVICLSLGLVGGFYAGRRSAPAAEQIEPDSALSAGHGGGTGSRQRTIDMPSPPATPGASATGGVPAVQPPLPPQGAPAKEPEGTGPLNTLRLPLDNLKFSDIQDTFNQARGGGSRRHEATDIMAPRGTPIRAVADGTIRKLFVSKPGGNTIYEIESSGTYCYYYAHLDRYADGITEGMRVKQGDLLGYVGSTGDADANAPHLHFAIFELEPEKNWWQGTPINPYPLLADAWRRQAR